ncbi:MAG: hypothetical protein GX889_09695 [Clostridiales bacterium]|nr:hypothetical protein [Clostridiales bacterium]
MKLKEFGKFQKLNVPSNKEFRKFLNENWRNRYYLYDDSKLYENEEEIVEQRYLIFDGDLVKARNYVGFISYKGESITIYPKIFEDNIEEDQLDSYLISNILYWLSKCTKIKFPIIDTNINFNRSDSILELFIYIFSKLTLENVYNNPYNSYEEVEEELPYLKGRLNTTEYLKSNIATGRWNNFNIIHEPYIYNNKLNKIIKFVSRRLFNITKNLDSKENLRKILFILDEIDDEVFDENACDNITLNRFNKDYEIILSLCEIFLKNSSITRNKDENRINFCFLFPMEIIYEDFLYCFVKEKFKNEFKDIISQKSNLYLADLYINEKYKNNMFNLKQDIFLRDNNDKIYILDTKYKILNSNRSKNYGISQLDMYQMCSYALAGGYNKLALVYPKNNNNKENIKFEVNSKFQIAPIEIEIVKVSFLLDYEEYKMNNNLNDLFKANDNKIILELKEYFKANKSL